MRRAAWLLFNGVVIAILGVATARAAAPGRSSQVATTDTTATYSTTTTDSVTTTTTAEATTTITTTTSQTATTTATTTTPQTTTVLRQPTPKPKHSHRHDPRKLRQQEPTRPPPDYPASPYPFLADGSLALGAQVNAVVSIAMRYLGVPYKWGGASPQTGFDCSGLVQYVFAQLGVSLPHYAAAQYYTPDAVWVAPSRLQPGDLVFFTGSDGTRKAPGHVGIYVGDGYLIDAPHTGSAVRIDSLNEPWFANQYVGAKRIVGASLDARRVLRMTKHARSVPAARLIPQIAGSAFGASLPPVAIDSMAAHTPAPREPELWTGVGSGGLLLILAVAIPYRHRRRRSPAPNRSTPN
jgi:murein DD-endopeptidase